MLPHEPACEFAGDADVGRATRDRPACILTSEALDEEDPRRGPNDDVIAEHWFLSLNRATV